MGNRPAALPKPAFPPVLLLRDANQETVTEKDCPICMESLSSSEKGLSETPCGHVFHRECLEQYCAAARIETIRCPLCRGSLCRTTVSPVQAQSSSGRLIQLVSLPAVGDRCHYDREYVFKSLGDFAHPGMLYLLTSNEDRKTPSHLVMWTVIVELPVVIHLNFRSERHIKAGNARCVSAARCDASCSATHGILLDTGRGWSEMGGSHRG